jgi:hypothetical protein
MRTSLSPKTFLITVAMVIGLFSQADKTHAVTYWLQSQEISPPYPFDPYGGALKIETLDEKAGQFLVLDTPEDYAALQVLKAAERELYEKENGGVARNGPEDGGGEAYAYGSDGLWLEIVSKTNVTAHLVIHTPDPQGVYDLFMTTNLNPNVPGLNLTNWVWLLRTEPGDTNLVVTNLWADEAYFRLGTMLDSDSDGLTDAYEPLVSHTGSSSPDSDSDGLADRLELEIGTDPLNPYSQDSTHTFKDGPWYLTARTGQSGTRALLTWENSDYDSVNDITYLLFSVAGITNTDNHHIYIQTPSIDPAATNLVWQDMFFDFGYLDWGFDPNTGMHWYETAWFGNVTNGVFTALDSDDRDFDGLQDGYEVLAASKVAGAPSSDNSGIPDGDVELNGLSVIQRWQYGLDPLAVVSSTDSNTNGLPDWFENYVKFWFGTTSVNAWDDADGDHLPNIVEFEVGTDPTLQGYWSSMPPPPSEEHVSLQFTAGFSGQDITNEFWVNFGLSGGPLGLGGSMAVLPSTNSGPGTAELQLEIWPLDQAYSAYAVFSDDADPGQGEFQKPDSADGDLYRDILIEATELAPEIWAKIDKQVLQALRSKTIEYIHAVSLLKIHRECRRIQHYQYLIAQGANRQAMLMRIRRSVSIVHTEITKVSAIHIEYVHRYPNLDWISRGLRAGGRLACAAAWYYNWPALMDAVRDYKIDVRNHQNFGAADILSSTIQSMLQDLPGLPNWLVIGLDPTIPIFSLNGPLGWYDGY